MDNDLALRIVGLSKAFEGTIALDNVSLTVRRGEVVGLVGHNGSGKSTLVRILAGYHRPDSLVELSLFGRHLPVNKLGLAERHRVGFVHQDLSLVPNLSILDNFLITLLRSVQRPYIDWPSARKRVTSALRRVGLEVSISVPVSELSQADRCLVAVARALDEFEDEALPTREQLLVLDEPTPFLPAEGVARLFAVMRQVAEDDGGIIFIAHDIDEVLSITDRIVVLRDGLVVAEFRTTDVSRDDVVSAIVGRPLEFHQLAREGAADQEHKLFRVRNLSGGGLQNVSLQVAAGEILGVTGLIGSGASALPELLTGARKAQGGILETPSAIIDLAKCTVMDQMRHGICLLPDDRIRKSGVGALALVDNLVLPALKRFTSFGRLEGRAIADYARAIVESSGVLPPRPEMRLGTFSGGNQQKALMGKWLALKPKLFVMSEPTQGVDIGALQGIYAAIEKAAKQGMAIICYSSDSAELAQICGRVVIFHRGRVSVELSGSTLTKDAVTTACLGATQFANSGTRQSLHAGQ
jgi:ribose transport system ATP-binding protein